MSNDEAYLDVTINFLASIGVKVAKLTSMISGSELHSHLFSRRFYNKIANQLLIFKSSLVWLWCSCRRLRNFWKATPLKSFMVGKKSVECLSWHGTDITKADLLKIPWGWHRLIVLDVLTWSLRKARGIYQSCQAHRVRKSIGSEQPTASFFIMVEDDIKVWVD